VGKAIAYDQGAVGQGLSDQVEVLVVDNCSTDGSVDWLRPQFPFAQFIANTENVGFSRANNQVLGKCRGKYVLFLNPDTILPEDCFQQCLSFMEAHPDAGALGVHMIDGSGRYLPESKRGFPTPWVSFCKMSGLTRLFPTSRWLASYYLGHLSPTGIHQVDVLSGAFMWIRKGVLDKTGGFDERFFMYAEDIDLSFRIQQAGYVNYYLPAPAIIHFKGESTRKDKRYIKLFYTAMIQFVQKHYKGIGAWGYTKLLQLIIASKGNTDEVKKAKQPTINDIRSFVIAKDEMVGSLKEQLNSKRVLTQEMTSADELIYIESLRLTFKDIIDAVQKNKGDQKIRIHASGSCSIVGSDSKDNQGVFIVLEKQ
jgi:GT2 family glycosyltransferase